MTFENWWELAWARSPCDKFDGHIIWRAAQAEAFTESAREIRDGHASADEENHLCNCEATAQAIEAKIK